MILAKDSFSGQLLQKRSNKRKKKKRKEVTPPQNPIFSDQVREF